MAIITHVRQFITAHDTHRDRSMTGALTRLVCWGMAALANAIIKLAAALWRRDLLTPADALWMLRGATALQRAALRLLRRGRW
jgi:hypothetical protein